MSLSDIHNQNPRMRVWIIQANSFLLWLAMHMDFWRIKPQMYVLLHAVIPRYLLSQLLCTTIWARLCSKELCQANVKRCLKDPWTHDHTWFEMLERQKQKEKIAPKKFSFCYLQALNVWWYFYTYCHYVFRMSLLLKAFIILLLDIA